MKDYGYELGPDGTLSKSEDGKKVEALGKDWNFVGKSTVLPPSAPDVGPAGDAKRDVLAKKKKVAQGRQRDSQDASFRSTTGGLALSKTILTRAQEILDELNKDRFEKSAIIPGLALAAGRAIGSKYKSNPRTDTSPSPVIDAIASGVDKVREGVDAVKKMPGRVREWNANRHMTSREKDLSGKRDTALASDKRNSGSDFIDTSHRVANTNPSFTSSDTPKWNKRHADWGMQKKSIDDTTVDYILRSTTGGLALSKAIVSRAKEILAGQKN